MKSDVGWICINLEVWKKEGRHWICQSGQQARFETWAFFEPSGCFQDFTLKHTDMCSLSENDRIGNGGKVEGNDLKLGSVPFLQGSSKLISDYLSAGNEPLEVLGENKTYQGFSDWLFIYINL